MRVYQFGLRPPVENEPAIRQQLRLAWEYRVMLTRLARARRNVERELEQRAGLRAALDYVERASAAVASASAAVQKAKVQGRSRRAVPAELREALSLARASLKDAKAQLREDRSKLRDELRPELDDIHERWLSMRRSCRAASGLRHGTYTAVEDALEQACSSTPLWDNAKPNDPRWPPWTGAGRVGVQLQGGRDLGAVADGDTFLRIHLVPNQGKRDWPRYGTLYLRIGSNEDRSPLWGAWPIKQHRPIPEHAIIKGAYVSLRREGPWERWTVELSVDESACVRKEKCGKGLVAVDIGWRRIGAQLRVAAWHDENEDRRVDGESRSGGGTFVLGERTLQALRKPEELRGVRDTLLQQMRSALCAELHELARRADPNDMPEWLLRATVRRRETLPSSAQAIAAIAQWRSHARFRRLALRWREHRWAGDDRALVILEWWRYRDHHLWEWESAQRNQALRRRRDQYRVWAAWLARTYEIVVLEHFDLAKLAKKPPAHEPRDEQEERAARWRQLASTHELRDCIINAVKARGGRILKVKAEWSTQDCPRCGCRQSWPAWATIERHPPCPECGCDWDQDDGSCIVMLNRGRECLSDPKSPWIAREKKKRNKHARDGESRWQRVARLRAEKRARMEAARKADDKNEESCAR